MASPQREWKHLQRKLRRIPEDEIAPYVFSMETDGLWCIVASELIFVLADDSDCESTWDDPLQFAQVERYVKVRLERVHASMESARAFVRSRLCK